VNRTATVLLGLNFNPESLPQATKASIVKNGGEEVLIEDKEQIVALELNLSV
jgi:hypothetical protein